MCPLKILNEGGRGVRTYFSITESSEGDSPLLCTPIIGINILTAVTLPIVVMKMISSVKRERL